MTNNRFLALASLALLLSAPLSAMTHWPDMQGPAPSVGGGDKDAAVIVGIESYAFVPPVPGAKSNADAWHDYFTKTRGIPAKNVTLLRNADGTLEDIQRAASKAAGKAKKGGAAWFVFIGHGAPSKDGKDGLLIGVDAQQKAASLEARSLSREDLLTRLGKTGADSIYVVLDACFSGRSPTGAPLAVGLQPLITTNLSTIADPRMTVLTAAKSDQFAGALPGASRPAFSYLVLGALRGWADADKDGKISAGEILDYATDSLDATLRGRQQTPTLSGSASAQVAASPMEKGPDLAALAKLEEPDSPNAAMFTISKLPGVPEAKMPDFLSSSAPKGNWRDLDVDALERYDAAVKFDRDQSATAAQKALRWTLLAKDAPQFKKQAAERAEKWKKYAQDEAAAQKARRDREAARDKDWGKLKRLLALEVVPKKDKDKWAAMFVEAYGTDPALNPHHDELSGFLGSRVIQYTRKFILEGKLDEKAHKLLFDYYVWRGKDPSSDITRYNEAVNLLGNLKTVKVEEREDSGRRYLYFVHLSKTYKVREIPSELPQRAPSFADDSLKLMANTILEEMSLLENGSKSKPAKATRR